MHTYVLITEYSITWKELAGKLYFGIEVNPSGGIMTYFTKITNVVNDH